MTNGPMKTDDLVAILARDAAATGPDIHRRLATAFAVAAMAAVALMVPTLGIRNDIAAASTSMLFPLKILAVATLAVGAMALVRAASRPEAELPSGVLVVPVLVLLVALGHEVATQLPAHLPRRLIGENWASASSPSRCSASCRSRRSWPPCGRPRHATRSGPEPSQALPPAPSQPPPTGFTAPTIRRSSSWSGTASPSPSSPPRRLAGTPAPRLVSLNRRQWPAPAGPPAAPTWPAASRTARHARHR